MSKSSILDQVVTWVHSDAAGAGAHREEFWSRARDAIAGDVFGVDATVVDWDLTHCVEHESLWFYACLNAAHIWARDEAGAAGAGQSYRDEVSRVGTSQVLRGARGQLERPYGP